MKHTYYSTCPICGANLDPGEKCTCTAEQKWGDFVNDTDRTGYNRLDHQHFRKLRFPHSENVIHSDFSFPSFDQKTVGVK